MMFVCFSGFVKFIDYEYSGCNYQAYDIGNHFTEFAENLPPFERRGLILMFGIQYVTYSPLLTRFQREVPSFDIIASEIEALKKQLSEIKSPAVLCHNDLLCKNIIYNKAKGFVKFIDYEYSGCNYQAYDIGNHFTEFAGVSDVNYKLYPSQELQRDWLATYLETYKQCNSMEPTVTDLEVNKLYVQVCKYALVSHFSWGLWALLQSRYSTIDFDFLR
ncbi:UNVERIFIED_CONTAM: hypothetical protein FKN15_025948 [Acipenser sinensis]